MRFCLVCVFSFLACFSLSADSKKLKVFIMAGQSNTVGHANGHTMLSLFNSDGPKDKELAKLVFNSNPALSAEGLKAQIELAKKIDALTGGIKMSKIKSIKDASEKAKLESQVKALTDKYDAYQQLVVDSAKVSDRVYINSIADRNVRSGKLGIGYGANTKKIGPEYGFGLSMAEKVDGPILIIKTSWGGKSINYNLRPPSSGEYEPSENQLKKNSAEKIKKDAGLNWRLMTKSINDVLSNLDKSHPQYDKSAGYEIAGFVWFQGFNDQFDPAFRSNYKDNMVNFIKDIRKEVKAPNMPFVIGVLGTGMTKEKVDQNEVSQGQRAAAKAPEFKGNVVSVESYTHYAHDFYKVFKSGWADNYRHWNIGGSDRPYHYLGSGKFFVRLGDSFADAMFGLMKK